MGGSPSRVRVIGPLVPHVAGFRSELESQGYRRHAVADQLRLMAHLSRWMQTTGVEVSALSPERQAEFLVARREAGYVLWLSQKALVPLVSYLTGLAVLSTPVVRPTGPAAELMERYRAYLVTERALALGTVVGYLHVARLFVAGRPQVEGLGLATLVPGEVIAFVESECRARSAGSAKYIVTGLRSFLRFCYLEGVSPRALAGAVPAVAHWKLAELPKALTRRQVAALLASCDRHTAFGRRDFAVLTVLGRLGLRAGEVAALCLDDIDWRAGELVVRGKGATGAPTLASRRRRGGRRLAQEREAPLPSPGGLYPGASSPPQAHHRRRVQYRFFCLPARRDPPVRAHCLRHTAATEMLAAGAGLREVGQVLRHSGVLTTSIYAKVDRARLAELAKPWPAGAPQVGGQ